jgi:hypothetical protein
MRLRIQAVHPAAAHSKDVPLKQPWSLLYWSNGNQFQNYNAESKMECTMNIGQKPLEVNSHDDDKRENRLPEPRVAVVMA